jgi:hypothetical protein
VTATLIFVAVIAIIAGVVGVMMRADRVQRRRIQRRRREAWKAAGGVGPCPGDDNYGGSYIID